MRFSIIVPIYNLEEYLPQCVESVLGQTFKDFELILVDDGSLDRCSVLCDNYAQQDNRIKVIHKQNGGLVSARKSGVKLAVGEYAVALDGDDWLKADTLESLNEIIEQYSPEIIRYGFIIANSDGVLNEKPISAFRSGYYDREQIEKTIIPKLIYGKDSVRFPHSICGSCIRMDIYRKEQLAVSDIIKIGEDGAVTRPIVYQAKKLFIKKECFYYYRRNLSSMTKSRTPFNLYNFKMIAEHYADRMDVNSFDLKEQIYRSVVHNIFVASVTQFWQKKNFLSICKDINEILDNELVKESIDKASFKTPFTRKLMLYVLKYRLFGVTWAFSKVKFF